MSVIEDEERKAYYEAFSAFDWNNNGKISYKSLIFAMRRAGVNPTEVEVHDMINRLDNGTGVLSFDDFLKVCGMRFVLFFFFNYLILDNDEEK